MTFVCPVSKLINLQVIEAKSAEAVLEGLIRLACEMGMPSLLILDKETSFMKMVRDAEVNLMDIEHKCYVEHGIKFITAPVSGHNFIGLAERKIFSCQELFEKIDLKSHRLHATGLQTFCKLVENQLNNTPLGYSYARDANNTALLKIVTPNLMKIGRLNSRSLSGPLKFPAGPLDYLKKVDEVYNAFFKIWNTSVLPKMIPQPKWFKSSPELKVNDVIFFQKVASDMNSVWTVGQVDSVTRSKDGVIRRVTVRYHNHGDTSAKYTDRAVRSLVKLFSLDDNYFIEDMAHVERLMSGHVTGGDTPAVTPPDASSDQGPVSGVTSADASVSGDQVPGSSHVSVIVPNGNLSERQTEAAPVVDSLSGRQHTLSHCQCCCSGHCTFSHFTGAGRMVPIPDDIISHDIVYEVDTDNDGETGDDAIPLPCVQDQFLQMLLCLETKFDLT